MYLFGDSYARYEYRTKSVVTRGRCCNGVCELFVKRKRYIKYSVRLIDLIKNCGE
jgi:hypothetical protein